MKKLANCTMHDQTPYLESYRRYGFEVEAMPRLREIAGSKDAIELAMRVIHELQDVEGILLGGRTDLCIYVALHATTHDLPVFVAETRRTRDAQNRFVFNCTGITRVQLGYPNCGGEIAAAIFPKKGD